MLFIPALLDISVISSYLLYITQYNTANSLYS